MAPSTPRILFSGKPLGEGAGMALAICAALDALDTGREAPIQLFAAAGAGLGVGAVRGTGITGTCLAAATGACAGALAATPPPGIYSAGLG